MDSSLTRSISRSPTARADFTPGPRPTVSPDVSGVYECPVCGEREEFIGTDAHGDGGPDFCNCDQPDGQHIPTCEVFEEVELVQSFTVIEQNGTPDGVSISYDSFEGGGSGAEIHEFTSICCATCNSLVWEAGTAE